MTTPVRACGPVLQRLHDTVVGRVGRKVLKPEQGCTLTIEHKRNPTERVVKVPERDPDASLDLHASPNNLANSRLEYMFIEI